MLCAEGLSCLLQQKEASGDLKGIRNGRFGPPISHLLFADTSVFFTKGDDRSIDTLKSALQTYCEGAGQKINTQKSSKFFGTHCNAQIKERIKQKMVTKDDTLQATYLGMPTWVGRSPTNCFNFLTGRIWKRLNGWSDRPLSRAGKEILLKSVAQAILTYVMSSFLLPISVCEKIRRSIANFWWGVEDGRRKVHWRSWKWLSSPKYLGGMGFRDPEAFNQALLAKQAWRIIQVPTSLCARVLKARYFSEDSILTATCSSTASYTFRSILHGRDLLREGLIWRIGDGSRVRIQHDNWIPRKGSLKPLGQVFVPGITMVRDLLNDA